MKREDDDRKAAKAGVNMDALKRVRSIEGQVRGIEKMVLQNRYCIDILTQIAAVRAALGKVSEEILRRHIETCVTADLTGDDPDRRAKAIEELFEVIRRGSL